MSRLGISTHWWSAVVGLMVACGPDLMEPIPEPEEPGIYASAVCEAIDSCGCFSRFESRDDCEALYLDRFAGLMASGLVLDDECFEDIIGGPEFGECTAVESVNEVLHCTVLQGSTRRGQPCVSWPNYVPPFLVDECAEDLVCLYGSCQDPETLPPNIEDGSMCTLTEPGSCALGGNVEFYCDRDEICRPKRAPGESCDQILACEFDFTDFHYCQGLAEGETGVCAPAVDIGMECDPAEINGCISLESGLVQWCDPSGICVDSAPIPLVCLSTLDPFRFVP